MREHKKGRCARRVIKTALWGLASIPLVIILALLVLQIPAVQYFIAQKVTSSLSAATHARVEVGSVSIAFTHTLVLRGVFIEDRGGDTLLSVKTLTADVNLLGLLSHTVSFHTLQVDSLTAHITRTLPDSSFNFDFLLTAFSHGSGPDTRPDTSAGPGWDIRLGRLRLNGIHVIYDDAVSGLNLYVQIGSLESSIEEIRLDRMQARVDDISLANTIASVVQTKETPHAESQPADVDVGFQSIALDNVRLNYENIVTKERFGVDVGKSVVIAQKVDLPARHIALKEFLLEGTQIAVVEPKTTGKKVTYSDVPARSWAISLDDLTLHGIHANYDVQGTPDTRGLDPRHLRVDSLTMRADHLFLSDDRIHGTLRQMSFREHSGLDVKEISGEFLVDSIHAQLTDFIVETAASRIRQNLLLRYTSLSALKALRGDVIVDGAVEDSHIAISDVLLVRPSLPIRNRTGATIRLTAEFSGILADVKFGDCRIATGESTRIDLTGSIRGLPEAATSYVDVNLREFSTGRNDIRALVADSVLPKNLVLPATINMNGQFRGTMKRFFASASIATSDGNVNGNAIFSSEKTLDWTIRSVEGGGICGGVQSWFTS